MKILTILGTRPELIRLSVIIKKLDRLVDHVLVFTNQNYTHTLSTIFFDELDIREPDYYFENNEYSSIKFLSQAMVKFEQVLINEKPDKVLVLGDTNSGLLSLVARKLNIPVFHMEAGNRSFDSRVPEEINRRLIDHLSLVNMPYTENSKQNLIREGFDKNHVFKIGNPIYEVMEYFKDSISDSKIMETLGLTNLGLESQQFILATVHRAENVDDKLSLLNIVNAINKISEEIRVILPLHPHTKDKLSKFDISLSENVTVCEPLGFLDFSKLERNAKLLISDSGSVPESGCINGIPSLIIRRSTERQELIECGSCILTDSKTGTILNAYRSNINPMRGWEIPEDYKRANVSDIVINILLGEYNI